MDSNRGVSVMNAKIITLFMLLVLCSGTAAQAFSLFGHNNGYYNRGGGCHRHHHRHHHHRGW